MGKDLTAGVVFGYVDNVGLKEALFNIEDDEETRKLFLKHGIDSDTLSPLATHVLYAASYWAEGEADEFVSNNIGSYVFNPISDGDLRWRFWNFFEASGISWPGEPAWHIIAYVGG